MKKEVTSYEFMRKTTNFIPFKSTYHIEFRDPVLNLRLDLQLALPDLRLGLFVFGLQLLELLLLVVVVWLVGVLNVTRKGNEERWT